MHILKPEDIDPNKITISKISSFNAGRKEITTIYISYNKKRLYIMGPKLYNPFGLSQWPKPDSENAKRFPNSIKYHMNCNFKGFKEGFKDKQSVGALYSLFLDMDLILIGKIMERSGDILSEETDEYSIIDNMYQRIIHQQSDEYDPYFKLKFPIDKKTKKYKCDFYNANNRTKTLNLDKSNLGKYMETRKYIRPIIEIPCLYYVDGKIYPSLECYQLKIYDSINKKKSKTKQVNKSKKNKNRTMMEFI